MKRLSLLALLVLLSTFPCFGQLLPTPLTKNFINNASTGVQARAIINAAGTTNISMVYSNYTVVGTNNIFAIYATSDTTMSNPFLLISNNVVYGPVNSQTTNYVNSQSFLIYDP